MNDEYKTERLASLDAHGFRRAIIPAEVKGFFRKHRDWSQIVLLLIFLLLPWVHFSNGEQMILLSLEERKFHLFGTIFYAHDAPKFFFLLFIFTLVLVFFTSFLGRVWCGWACPQTVFIDGVYRRIEKWIEGNYIERRKLHESAWNFNKIWKKSLKWVAFTAVSSLFAHSLAAYFVGSHEIIYMVQKSPLENEETFLVVLFITALLLFDFGWFKEQFCIIMCPYGRFQAALMDPNSLTVVYDVNRGEPRKGTVQPGEKQGDCISCQRCVQVCPTGIDIRKGSQLECIACTACIDACDEIMEKVKKPKGLIRYDTLSGKKPNMFNLRSMLYFTLITVATIGLVITLRNRADVEITVLRAKEDPYTIMKLENGDQLIMNHFRIHIKNQSNQDETYKIALPSDSIYESLQVTMAQDTVVVPSTKDMTVHLFVRFKPSILVNGKMKAQVNIINKENITQKEMVLIGP